MNFRLISFDLRAPASDRFLVMSTFLMLVGHASLWLAVSRSYNIPFVGILDVWDSAYYTSIASQGYSGVNWAFFPLYPLVVRLIGAVLPAPLPIVGTLISVACFLGFVFWIMRIKKAPNAETRLLYTLWPKTRFGWLVFLFAPCSYIFHSHHTESLYLLLMLSAFCFFANERWVATAIVVGLAALTKNQGVLLAFACGIGALATNVAWAERIRRFTLIGGISAAIFALFPLYQYFKTGDPLTFVSIQHHWRPEITLESYFRTFWFGNSWQNTNSGSIHRSIFFFLIAGALMPFAFKVRQAVVSLYLFLHIAIMPMSGEFVGAFRYGTVLFPLLFFIGDQAALKSERSRVVLYLMWPVLLWLVWYNFGITRRFALSRWAY